MHRRHKHIAKVKPFLIFIHYEHHITTQQYHSLYILYLFTFLFKIIEFMKQMIMKMQMLLCGVILTWILAANGELRDGLGPKIAQIHQDRLRPFR